MKKLKIGFICVHNSCRSIMAEGICRKYYGDMFEVYSAGTVQKDQVNQDAVSLLKEEYQITDEFNSKLLETLPELDIVITMGCNVNCPYLPSKYREDFGLDDPTGKDEEVFKLTAKIIELKLELIVRKLNAGEISID
ncbi:MAG: low molecular weight phosphatase family protein [Mycoplasmatales bacterium]